MDEFAIQPQMCRTRQQRLVEVLQEKGLTGAIVLQNSHVQWLTGVYFPPVFSSAAYVDSSGQVTLVAPHKKPENAVADLVETFPAKMHSTMRNDQNRVMLERMATMVGPVAGPIGVEGSTYGLNARALFGDQVQDIEPDLYRLRRKKEVDELLLIQHAIGATEKMYSRARQILCPGVSEIDMFNQLQTVAVEHFAEPLTGTGNDYQCGSRGGPPRKDRVARAGELYILDLGPAFRGYFADNSRTLAVTEPDDNQLVAWEYIQRAFQHVERTVRPGKSCRELFQEVQELLDECPVGVFNHHLGHGIGLFPHEGPHLNPNWDDVFEVGDVFTAEPGLYDPEKLKAGLRIENDYLVTESGVRNLCEFSQKL